MCIRDRCYPIIAAFPHSTSRALDPATHTHCLWINAGVREDGSTGTIRSRDLYEYKMAAGAAYRARLDFELTRLGYSTEQDKTSFKVRGVSDKVCEHFSTRRKEILDKTDALGFYSAEAAAFAAQVTRSVKGHVARAELEPRWQSESTKLGLSPVKAAALRKPPTLERPATQVERIVQKAVDEAAVTLAEERGFFTDADLSFRATTSLHGMGVTPESIAPVVGEKLATLKALTNEVAINRYTTKEHYDLETRMIESANALSRNCLLYTSPSPRD